MISPTGGRVTLGFNTVHRAVDIANAPKGQAKKGFRKPVAAPVAGIVTYVGQMGSGVSNAGLVVQIGDPKTNAHRLCHLDSYVVKKGDKVFEGQLVGYIGHTGFTIPAGINGTHLHWIMFSNGRRVDPRLYVVIPPVGTSTVKAKPKPPAPKPECLYVRKGEGLSHLAKRAGYKDWNTQKRWQAITNLNKKGWTWQKYNASLKRVQKVRVK